MARADSHTLIPLDTAARVIGIDPLHFNSIVTSKRTENLAQEDMWYQHNWQDAGKLSREDFAFALAQAEMETATHLGYWPLPKWVNLEEHSANQPYQGEYRWRNQVQSNRAQQSLRTRWGHVVSFGIRATSVIEEDSAVVLSDPDGDGYNELATVTVVTTVTDVEEIRVFYPGKSAANVWEIRPVDVSISSGTATITFPKYLIPLENLIEILNGNDDFINIDGDDDTNFLTTVDVYRVYNDGSDQVTYYYPNDCACGTDSCAVCEESTQTGCMTSRNQELGIVRHAPATYDSDTGQFTAASLSKFYIPPRFTINYRAGLRNHDSDYPSLRISPAWARLIVYYALTKLDNEIAGGHNIKRVFFYQTTDMAESDDNRSRTISASMLNNPLGTTRAAISLWRMIQQHRLFEG